MKTDKFKRIYEILKNVRNSKILTPWRADGYNISQLILITKCYIGLRISEYNFDFVKKGKKIVFISNNIFFFVNPGFTQTSQCVSKKITLLLKRLNGLIFKLKVSLSKIRAFLKAALSYIV